MARPRNFKILKAIASSVTIISAFVFSPSTHTLFALDWSSKTYNDDIRYFAPAISASDFLRQYEMEKLQLQQKRNFQKTYSPELNMAQALFGNQDFSIMGMDFNKPKAQINTQDIMIEDNTADKLKNNVYLSNTQTQERILKGETQEVEETQVKSEDPILVQTQESPKIEEQIQAPEFSKISPVELKDNEIKLEDPLLSAQAAGISSLVQEPKIQESIKVVVVNGIANEENEGTFPWFGEPLKLAIITETGLSENNIYLLPMFENGNVLTDSALWSSDIFTDYLTTEIIIKLDNQFALRSDQQRDTALTAILYSGAYNPFVKAIETKDYNVQTIVALGSPTFRGKDTIGNTNLKLIVNVYCEKEMTNIENIASNTTIPFIGDKHYKGIEVINVRILHADHLDYFNNPEKSANNTIAQKINKNTSDFVVRISAASIRGQTFVREFLDNLQKENNSAVTIDNSTKTYIVNPLNLVQGDLR